VADIAEIAIAPHILHMMMAARSWVVAIGVAWMACWNAGAVLPQADTFDSQHRAWGRVLAARVRDGTVDYSALKKHPTELNAYLDDMASISRVQFDGWTQPQQMAFLINLYNAATLKLVVDYYPVSSIKKIGGLFESPWKLKVVRLWGEKVTLDHLEHDLLRTMYREPRLHFALVCAAKSCPPLRSEAYTGDQLSRQLEDQGKLFLAQKDKNRFEAATKTLWLSPIFKWYEADFTRGDVSLATYVEPFLPGLDRGSLQDTGWKIAFTEYDWSLNER
jgi:Protein of unknown function, DUF547